MSGATKYPGAKLQPTEKRCAWCGQKFMQNRRDQKFCKAACRVRMWEHLNK